jgi:hypothetical protein
VVKVAMAEGVAIMVRSSALAEAESRTVFALEE